MLEEPIKEPEKSKSVLAVELTRQLFESIHGNLGILRFTVEKLTPKNGTNGRDSKKWEIICSFYETLGSTKPTTFNVFVDLEDNSLSLTKIDGITEIPVGKYKFVEE